MLVFCIIYRRDNIYDISLFGKFLPSNSKPNKSNFYACNLFGVIWCWFEWEWAISMCFHTFDRDEYRSEVCEAWKWNNSKLGRIKPVVKSSSKFNDDVTHPSHPPPWTMNFLIPLQFQFQKWLDISIKSLNGPRFASPSFPHLMLFQMITVPFRSIQQKWVMAPPKSLKCNSGDGHFGQVPNPLE